MPLIKTVSWALLGSILFFVIEFLVAVPRHILYAGFLDWSGLELLYYVYQGALFSYIIDVFIALLLPSYLWVSLAHHHPQLARDAIRKAATFFLIALVASLGVALYWTEGDETYIHIDGPPTTVFSRFSDLWLDHFPFVFFSLTGAWWVHRYFRLDPLKVDGRSSIGNVGDTDEDVT